MTDYSKMSDYEISCEVGRAISFADYLLARNEQKNYCNSWADAGPIIEENKISINAHGINGWMAWKNTGKNLEQISSNRHQFSSISVRPLRSAMECFLMMKESENDS